MSRPRPRLVTIGLADLPHNVAALHRKIGDLAAALDNPRGETQAETDRLWRIVKVLQRGRFVRRSERLADGQLPLGLENFDADIARTKAGMPVAAGSTSFQTCPVHDSEEAICCLRRQLGDMRLGAD